MKVHFDKSLFRTILFSLAVVSFVIGAYETVLQNDKNALLDHYWLFMISFVCVLLFRYLKPEEEVKPAPKPKQPASNAKPVPRNKRRG
ncbi:hypothetical protein J0X19_17435 [Hymenobacter sp. BT186]|uniref:Uncharacterized protein n=1 Tax=Hymenobacter telluris TaxID=2816474 RepID=A0A939EYF2_9BACT|nr:hypothetical protein [Hymenobacter telluris]MBO0359748.1 hypothetical protein [Hymenobacter telluris]MBW3375775.1 hypothetical protein [Hymenobacter norwichensis]